MKWVSTTIRVLMRVGCGINQTSTFGYATPSMLIFLRCIMDYYRWISNGPFSGDGFGHSKDVIKAPPRGLRTYTKRPLLKCPRCDRTGDVYERVGRKRAIRSTGRPIAELRRYVAHPHEKI